VRHAEYEAKTSEDNCIHSWCAMFVIMSKRFLTWWSVCITRCYSNQRHPVFGSALSPITATLLYTCWTLYISSYLYCWLLSADYPMPAWAEI